MSSQYHHHRLTNPRSIRLLTLLPSPHHEAPIQGQLTEVDLDSKPVYEAVSYLCGEKQPGHVVSIADGHTDRSKGYSNVAVTANCVSALRILRDRVKSRTLWVDAICIDQARTFEKNQQVALMTEIFGTAKAVLIWLDPGAETATQVKRVAQIFQLVGCLYESNLLQLYGDFWTSARMPTESTAVTHWEKFIDTASGELGDSFNAPLLNRYFQRVWTVQEIAMAHQIIVHYGSEKIQWRDFAASALFAVSNSGFARNRKAKTTVAKLFRDSVTLWRLNDCLDSHFVLPDPESVKALFDDADERNTLSRFASRTIELVLLKSKVLEATDPKDKAYAMLWAFQDASAATQQLQQVDYEKSLELIYTEFTTATFVKLGGTTELLYLVNSQTRLASLPSWVPDWSQQTPMLFFGWAWKLRKFQAAGEQSLRSEMRTEDSLLRITGTEYCGIRSMVRFSDESRQRDLEVGDGEHRVALTTTLIETARLLKIVIDKARMLADPNQEHSILEAVHRVVHSQMTLHRPGPEDQLEFFAQDEEKVLSDRLDISVGLLRVQVFDRISFLIGRKSIPQGLVETALSEFLPSETIEKVLQEAETLLRTIPSLAVVIAVSRYIDLNQFLRTILLHHRNKDFFVTTCGNVGMTFQGLFKGELVVLWEGCPSPMIVRKLTGEQEGRYHLHGPAYVDGIMTGEAWPTDECQLREFEVV